MIDSALFEDLRKAYDFEVEEKEKETVLYEEKKRQEEAEALRADVESFRAALTYLGLPSTVVADARTAVIGGFRFTFKQFNINNPLTFVTLELEIEKDWTSPEFEKGVKESLLAYSGALVIDLTIRKGHVGADGKATTGQKACLFSILQDVEECQAEAIKDFNEYVARTAERDWDEALREPKPEAKPETVPYQLFTDSEQLRNLIVRIVREALEEDGLI